MDEAALGERCEALAHAVLGPLVLGGPVHPVRPLGGSVGLRLGVGRRVMDADLSIRLEVARLRRARLLAPVDTLPALDQGDWAMLAGLNDLLQMTNHKLMSTLTRDRHDRLIDNLWWLCERIPAPRTIERALSRHATFARALEIVRTDATVFWWTGSARFRGEPPPARLMAWPAIRRVHMEAQRVPLVDMAAGLVGFSPDDYVAVLGQWLTRSPLTDLATAGRARPVFAWSKSTLSFIATAPGRALAFRAITRWPEGGMALGRAVERIPAGLEEARQLAEGFASEVCKGLAALPGEGS